MEYTKTKVWAAIIAGFIGWYGRRVGQDFGIDASDIDLVFTVIIVPIVVYFTKNKPKPTTPQSDSLFERFRRWIA